MADEGKPRSWMDENGMLKSGRIFYPAKKSFRRAIKQVARSRKHFTVRDVLENLEKRFQTAPGAALPIVKDEMIKLLAKKGIVISKQHLTLDQEFDKEDVL